MIVMPMLAAGMVPVDETQVSLNQILRAVRTHLGMEVGFISEFHDGCRVFRHVESAHGKQCIEVGGSDPLEDSYCHWVVEGELPRLICDPRDHEFTARIAATETLPVGAHLSVPILLRDGRVYGTFCCFSRAPDRTLSQRDLATMEAFAQIASEHIQQLIDQGQERRAKRDRIEAVLREGNLAMVYQPAIRPAAPCVEFMEALARFRTMPNEPPDFWFATAHEVGLGQELELLAIRMAVADGLSRLPDRMALSVNASPEVILNPDFASVVAAAPHRLIVEITEHEAVTRYSALRKALTPLRAAGLRVAIDDMGAGFSSLRHILHVKPDIVKLDMTLSQGIDRDPTRRALTAALVSFARETNSMLVAEGVETLSELETLKRLGVDVVQGYLFGQPAPMDEQGDLSDIASRFNHAPQTQAQQHAG